MTVPPTPSDPIENQLRYAAGLLQHGQPAAAWEALKQLPQSASQLNLLSQAQLSLLQQSRDEGAQAERQSLQDACHQTLQDWSRLVPREPEPWLRMARLALLTGEFDKAVKRSERAKKLQPRSAVATYLLAIALQLAGKPGSRPLYEAVIQSRASEKLSALEVALEIAVEQFETEAGAHGLIFEPASVGSDGLIAQELRRVLKQWLAAPLQSPSPRQIKRYADACYNLGVLEMAAYDRAATAAEWFDRCLQIDPTHVQALTNAGYALNYRSELAASTRLCEQLVLGQRLSDLSGGPSRSPLKNADPERDLRIGFLSADLRQHSVGYFAVAVIEALANTRHEIHVYHTTRSADALTTRVQEAVQQFVSVADLSDTALARQLATDQLDILVDLNGYSRGHRAQVLARRMAPVQISWLGYPATTGLPAMDFRIVDEKTDPPGALVGSETLVRLPRPFLCYEPPAAALNIDLARRARPGHDRPITFGCFNHLPKLHAGLIENWATILDQVPGSRLLLKNAGIPIPDSNRRIFKDLEAAGIAPDRIRILGREPSLSDHLRRYLEVDIALDSWPYQGTTTTCEALIMGTPMVSLAGDHHAARIAASLLPAVGLEDLVADDPAAYVQVAVNLAGDSDRLLGLHTSLRETFRNSALMDLADFVTHYEAALRSAWKHRCLQTTP